MDNRRLMVRGGKECVFGEFLAALRGGAGNPHPRAKPTLMARQGGVGGACILRRERRVDTAAGDSTRIIYSWAFNPPSIPQKAYY
jgi:hypothetical protein